MKIPRVRGIEHLSLLDLAVLATAAQQIGAPVGPYAAVQAFESGLNPAQYNLVGSGAVGLIQFMPQTARNLRTTCEDLAKMSFAQQTPYVVRYFKSFGRKLDTLEKLYCAVFWPRAIDEDDDYVIGRSPSPVYKQNKGFDLQGNQNGEIDRGEICRAVRAVLAAGESRGFIELPDAYMHDRHTPELEPLTDAERSAILDHVMELGHASIDPDFLDPGAVSGDEDPH